MYSEALIVTRLFESSKSETASKIDPYDLVDSRNKFPATVCT